MAESGLSDPLAHPDREADWRRVHEGRWFAHVAALLTDDLVAEHAANPLGAGPDFPSPALHRVLTCLRSQPIRRRYQLLRTPDGFALLATEPGGPISVMPGISWPTLADAAHGLFLIRVAELREAVGTDPR